MVAAEMTGRTCYGVEINPTYVDVSVLRWEQFTGKKAELAGRLELEAVKGATVVKSGGRGKSPTPREYTSNTLEHGEHRGHLLPPPPGLDHLRPFTASGSRCPASSAFFPVNCSHLRTDTST